MVSGLSAEAVQYHFSADVASGQGVERCGGRGARSVVLLHSAFQDFQHVDFTNMILSFPLLWVNIQYLSNLQIHLSLILHISFI